MEERPILIAGAGPTGLALAVYLAKFQVPVRIIDKLPAALDTSRAVAVQARTLEFYQTLGLAETVMQESHKVPGVNLWVNGHKAARVPLENIGRGLSPFPYVLTFSQNLHERLLIDTLRSLGVYVERSAELTGFEELPTYVRATVKRADGSEQIIETPYLAGCDGARSVVRQTLHTSFPGGTYSQIFYVADVDAAGPPADGELHIDLAQSDFVAVFPLKGEGRARLIGSLRPTADKPDHEPTFEDASKHALEQLQLTVKKVHWFSTYHVHHRVAEHFRYGRAFLLGDAAHIHSPAGGQGMNTGIGDAINLAWKLAAVVKGNAPDNLLDTFETERLAFARKLVETTDRLFTLATDPRSGVQMARTKIVPAIMPEVFRLPPMRRFLFRTVSQIGIQYRQSALSEGKVGGIAGGDRLPWIELDNGSDNFAPLMSLSWQVHIYGSAPAADLVQACDELRIPLHHFPWQTEMLAKRFRRNALYLLRPDGHVALVDKDADPRRLAHYFATRAIVPAAGQ